MNIIGEHRSHRDCPNCLGLRCLHHFFDYESGEEFGTKLYIACEDCGFGEDQCQDAGYDEDDEPSYSTQDGAEFQEYVMQLEQERLRSLLR